MEKNFHTLLAVGVGLALSWFIYRRYFAFKYKIKAKILKLIIYPVKSLRGVEVDHLETTATGFKYRHIRDRCWLIVDGNNSFITQRQEPTLALLNVNIVDDGFIIESPDGNHLKVSTQKDRNEKPKTVRIWKNYLQSVDCGDIAAGWLQNYLGRKDVRLVEFIGEKSTRSACPNDVIDNSSKIIYHDASPCMIMNESSINDINKQLDEGKVSYRNFRPNILIDKSPPFIEDTWYDIKIGSIRMKQLSLNDRCRITTINTETAQFQPFPLDQMKETRKIDGYSSPCAGVYFKFLDHGKISTGEMIEVAE